MLSKKNLFVTIGIVLLFSLYGLTFIPRHVVNIDIGNVSKIELIKGDSGERIILTSNSDIEHIIGNLNKITFQRQQRIGNITGFIYGLTIYDKEGKSIKTITIRGGGTIRFDTFSYLSYKSVKNSIDYDYIEDLFLN